MLTTIYLNNQSCPETYKVNDVPTNWNLASKPEFVQLLAAKP